MGNVSINVYAINSSANTPFRVEGIDLATIKKVMSTWDNYGNWIGSNKPSNYQSINSQLVVAKDAISNDTDNYYDNRTLEELIPELSGAPAPAYKVYTALLTQSGGDNVQSITSGELTIGVTYQITGTDVGFDVTNVGAPNNNVFTSFVATGTTPNWGEGGAELQYNSGAPVVTVLENTIGNIWWTYNFDESWAIANCENAFTSKTFWTISLPLGSGAIYTGFVNNINEFVFQNNLDNSFFNTPIEIRVYN